MTSVSLRDGSKMPGLGLGCWKISKSTAADAVFEAIKIGYRHIDGACDYGNEKEVGEGISRAISEGIVARSDLWVTSKIWMTYHAKEHVELALQRSLDDLKLDYIDLWLIHFPISLKFVPFEKRYPPEWIHDPESKNPTMVYDAVPLFETFQSMRALSGPTSRVRHVGVCNFTTGLLADLYRACERVNIEPPEVLQVEMHPYLVQEKLLRFCKNHSISVTAFSPLGAGSYIEINMATKSDSALVNPVIVAISNRLQVTAAQVILAWHMKRGVSAIPKSSNPARLAENLASISIADRLTEEDVQRISALDQHRRFNDPGVFTQGMNSFCPIFD
jgi:D-xylose reductase